MFMDKTMNTTEKLITRAADAIVAYAGRNERGLYRTHCITCNDASPLTHREPIFGDLCDMDLVPTACDICGITLLQISRMCEAEYLAEQTRLGRVNAPTVLIEYGVRGQLQCKVF